ncbi:MAG: NADH-quinone oxidoreductase subunit NuoK [Deltaproteobacteria bacterium]|nr:NADH-quinone oxidoreductase subunit NuoK [Deltaproteobacteria bacterium]
MSPMNVTVFATALFFVGLFGVLARRNILVIMMSIEIMLNAANLTFVNYSRQMNDAGGQMAVFFIITVAAAEAAVGLGLVIALFRNLKSVSTEDIQLLKE